MKLNRISEHKAKLIGEDDFFKAAVCIALLERGEEGGKEYDVLFQVRSSNIPDQPGDICLPGGALEKDEQPRQAAIRETCEELLIQPEQITIIGESDRFHVRNMMLYPFVGIIHDYHNTFSQEEVAEVFRVPLQFFLQTEPDRYSVDTVVQPEENFPYELIVGGKDYRWRTSRIEELFYQYEGRVIWGITARIMNAFCEIIQ